MTQIELVRQEIERRMKIYKESNYGISLRYQELEELLSFLDTLSEEPDKSLEEEYKDYVENDPVYSKLVNRNAGLGIVRHFAEWGAEHLRDTTKMIDKSLEKAAEKYAEPYISTVADNVKWAFKAGAEWQASQMPMPEDTVLFQKGVAEGRRLEGEDSVECEVTDVGLNYLDLALFEAERLGLNKGDKVKVIVLKDNEDESK